MRLFADFHNADTHGRLRLNCDGTVLDLARTGVRLTEGLQITVYSEELEADARVTFSKDERIWVAQIDSGKITAIEAAPVDALARLEGMLVSFLEGSDRSLRLANQIEGVLLDYFDDDESLQDLLLALASYRPGGGDFLYDENTIRPICAEALAVIRDRQRLLP